MTKMNTESLAIIMEIFQLKRKLIKSIVPEQTMKHLDVIGSEIKEIIKESLQDHIKDDNESSKVKKVEIG